LSNRAAVLEGLLYVQLKTILPTSRSW